MRGELTERQRAIYDYIVAYFVANQRHPTYQEMRDKFGMKSKNGVAVHLKSMVRKNWLAFSENRPGGRSLIIAGFKVVLVPI